MVSNPMQKKARNSFLLGVVITLIICLIIGVLFYFLFISKNKQKKEEERGEEVTAYVLNADIKSGQIITSDLLTPMVVYENMVPQNYIDQGTIENMQYGDVDGNVLQTNSDGKLYIKNEKDNNNEYTLISSKPEDKNKILIEAIEMENEQNINEKTYKFYKTKKSDGSKVNVELTKTPIIAKIDMYKNSIITADSVTKNQMVTNDLRYVEYNMLTLPTTIAEGDYIDIRLTLPNGQDLIVVSKKEVKSILGNTVGLKLSEGEILMMESAIVEAYIMSASKLYAIQYVEPGMQQAAINTYTPTDAVKGLIERNSNIVPEAKKALTDRFNNDIRLWTNTERNDYLTEQQENLEQGLQKEIENAKAAREAYLNGLTSY